MQSHFDTICAIITPLGKGAVSTLRISGKNALETIAGHFSKPDKLRRAAGHSLTFGTFYSVNSEPLDEVLIAKFVAPRSYTGEDVLEISCHGNPLIANSILETLLTSIRLAEPGEFTRRAYLNGKLDLIQAEAVGDLIDAQSSKSETSALLQLQGYLTKHLLELLEGIKHARLRMELAIDFSDQDLPQIDLEQLETDLEKLHSRARNLYSDSKGGKYLREGIRVCLSGAPNVGKSSLFNALLRENRAIVSPRPGTTRDYLEESVSLEGYAMIVYDTAGLRNSTDEIEMIGISRTRELMESADFVVELRELPEFLADPVSPTGNKHLLALTKIDTLGFDQLPTEDQWQDFLLSRGCPPEVRKPIPVSSVLAGGLNLLTAELIKRLSLPELRTDSPIITNTRQLAALKETISCLEKALDALRNGLGFEFVAFDLIAGASALQQILGITTPDDLLGEIFSNFCVGK